MKKVKNVAISLLAMYGFCVLMYILLTRKSYAMYRLESEDRGFDDAEYLDDSDDSENLEIFDRDVADYFDEN